jgi:hypothetical protein
MSGHRHQEDCHQGKNIQYAIALFIPGRIVSNTLLESFPFFFVEDCREQGQDCQEKCHCQKARKGNGYQKDQGYCY